MHRNPWILFALIAASTWTGAARAADAVEVLPTRTHREALLAAPTAEIQRTVRRLFDTTQYRGVKAQVINDEHDRPDHLLVQLLSKHSHRVDFAKVDIDAAYHATAFTTAGAYELSATDLDQQLSAGVTARCPDATVEFIAFAPNDDALEQQITVDVANAAIAKGLKTVQLLRGAATSAAYINYMSCPNLKGNFYDGDANPNVITTVDGVISHTSFSDELRSMFRHKVTNIWLACQAYNDPMLGAVVDGAQTRKYAAGINDLEIGPSDRAAACAMKAALAGQPMTAAFQACYQRYDNSDDHWGFGGQGSDDFFD
jgi:hypothetical protein